MVWANVDSRVTAKATVNDVYRRCLGDTIRRGQDVSQSVSSPEVSVSSG